MKNQIFSSDHNQNCSFGQITSFFLTHVSIDPPKILTYHSYWYFFRKLQIKEKERKFQRE